MTEKQFRKIIERQRKKDAYDQKREKRREMLGGVVKTAALVGAVVGAKYGADKLKKSGYLSKVIGSSHFKAASEEVRAATDFVQGAAKAISSTYHDKGLKMFTSDTSKSLANNLTRYLGKYSEEGVKEIAKQGADTFSELVGAQRKILNRFAKNRTVSMQKDMVKEAMSHASKSLLKNGTSQDTIEGIAGFYDSFLKTVDKNLERVNNKTPQGGRNMFHEFLSKVLDPADDKSRQLLKEELKKQGIDEGDFRSFTKKVLGDLEKNKNLIADGPGTYGESFFNKALKNNKSLQESYNKLKKSTFQDITDYLSRETTKTGQFLREGGLQGVTVKDALENQLFDEDFTKKAFDGLNIYDELKDAKRLLDKESYEKLMSTNIDSAIFRNNEGDILDLRHIGKTRTDFIHSLADNIQVPFVGIKPFKMAELLNPTGGRELAKSAFFKKGTFMDTITGSAEALADDYYVLGDVLRKIDDNGGEVIRKNVELVKNSPYDTVGNQIRRMTGRSGRGGEENLFQKVTDLGRQDTASVWDKLLYKYGEKHADRSVINAYKRITDSGIDFADIEAAGAEAYQDLSDVLTATRNYTRKHLNTIDKETFELFSPLNATSPTNPAQNYSSIYDIIMKAATPEEAVESFKNKYSTSPILNIISNARSDHEAYKQLQNAWFNEIGYENVNNIAQKALESGTLASKQHQNIQRYIATDYLNNVLNSSSPNDFKQAFDAIRGDTALAELVENVAKDSTDLTKVAGHYMGSNPFEGNDYIVVNKTKNVLSSINEIHKKGGTVEDMFDALMNDGVYQFGFGGKKARAGRDAMDKVSRGTAIPFFMGSRLSDGLSSIGLGLGAESMGSTQSLYANLYLKRILLPLAAVSTAMYANDMIGNVFGTEPSDALASTYAQMTIDVQKMKDVTGINDFTQAWGRALQGSEHLFENPVGGLIKYASFGLIGDDRGSDELKYFYEKGTSAVRKGRGWGIGSASPIYGGRIERFDPSWYRRIIGEPEMTDSQWGSESEYWANHWLPTPHNPIGPLKKLIDPYHWENKHMEDRPWAVSGRIQELNSIPLVGPVLDSTVGRIIKPTRKHPLLKSSHEEMLSSINEQITNYYGNEIGYGNMMFGGGSARVESVDVNPGFTTSVEGGSYNGGYAGANFSGTGVGPGMGMAGPGGPGMGGSGGPGFDAAAAQLSYINSSITNLTATNVSKSRSTDIAMLQDEFLVDDINGLPNPNGLMMGLSDSYYSAGELGGIYGYYAGLVLGDMEPQRTLQDSTWALSANKTFWDRAYGGIGGDISEIYRRFLPNDRKIDTYNPIRNTMPDWMPDSSNYFKDFKHGDPMAELPGGVYRLPGSGYEAINKLNSDPYFGRYGALDRMKILGDVAPWSQQYKYYSKATSILHDAGVYTDEQYEEAQRTRDQVSALKNKYDFQEYRFNDRNLKRETVTVDSVLSDFSFTTKENPGEVYKLAGISLPNKTAENRAEVEEYLNRVIHGGARIKIAKSSDPLNYTGSDTKNSIKVAAFVNGSSIQKTLVDDYKVKANYDDKSDAATEALYSSTQKVLGGVWETITHHDNWINNKFMRNRSAVEEYERSIVYGKSFQSWDHPIRDWLKPTANRLAAQSPISAGVAGALIGGFSSLFLGKGLSKTGAIIGAGIGGVLSAGRVYNEQIHRALGEKDYTFIPSETKKRREINEYFDKLKYVKYKGLYNKAAELAKKYEGVNINDVIQESQRTPYIDKRLRKELDGVKKWLAIGMSDSHNVDKQEAQEKIRLINEFEKGKDQNKVVQTLGPYSRMALKYKEEYESTLYGADPNGDFMKIYAALPKEDRPFFQNFMSASPKDRQRILKLVPENQKKFYEAKWGIKKSKIDLKDNLITYFSTHKMPKSTWKGWRAGEDLEKVKIKYLNSIGENVGDYGYFKDDVAEARHAPTISGTDGTFGVGGLGSLRAALKGKGLKDIQVFEIGSYIDRGRDRAAIDLDIKYNRRKEMEDLMYKNIPGYL